jgi:hypothetical protein
MSAVLDDNSRRGRCFLESGNNCGIAREPADRACHTDVENIPREPAYSAGYGDNSDVPNEPG